MHFWKDLTHTLICWGFEVNSCEQKNEGKLCTVLCHIDDIKISHVNKVVVSHVIDYLSNRDGKEAPLTVTRE